MNIRTTPMIDWDALDAGKFADENIALERLAARAALDQPVRDKVRAEAVDLVKRARASKRHRGLMESFLQEFGLSNKEGLALMCLAEALLRVPDAETADDLISEKIGSGKWASMPGKSDNWLVNASTLGLMLTGSMMERRPRGQARPGGYFRAWRSRMGEPVIRTRTMQAMRILGEQFVLGRSIKARSSAGAAGRCMARCAAVLSTCWARARAPKPTPRAITSAIWTRSPRSPPSAATGRSSPVDGVSVKLSALHPRYQAVKEDAGHGRALSAVLEQAEAAKAAEISASALDAEESRPPGPVS
jgi:RHH-type proline utilization regulon transcriptional repressor/proline dehydrogenase/delta 1-pyrroline-5-carboxylate dehydrogenase